MRIIVAVALLATFVAGCGSESKKADDGPRVTGGQVDPNAKPQRPTIGGSVKDK